MHSNTPIELDATHILVWFEDQRAWYIRWTFPDNERYSIFGFDTPTQGMLAFERGDVAYQAEPPGAGQ